MNLVRYDQARVALAECAQIDEAKDIRDKAAALAEYARQRDDVEMKRWVAEIHLRACIRIGELSRELDKVVTTGGGTVGLPASGKPKAVALAEAGLSTSTAGRYEELAGGRDANAMRAATAAAEIYFVDVQATKEPPTMAGLRDAIRDAVKATMPPRPPKPAPNPELDASAERAGRWIDMAGSVRRLAEQPADAVDLVPEIPAPNRTAMLRDARTALGVITPWIEALERKANDDAAGTANRSDQGGAHEMRGAA